jgi:hypothetical protein
MAAEAYKSLKPYEAARWGTTADLMLYSRGGVEMFQQEVTPCQRPKQQKANTMDGLPEYTQDQIEALEAMHFQQWQQAMWEQAQGA